MSKRIDLDTLETELKEHAWTYEMSDHHSYWTSGTNQRSMIRAQVEKLYDMGLGKKVEVLFYKHYPVEGVQFHPESILTLVGKDILQTFLLMPQR